LAFQNKRHEAAKAAIAAMQDGDASKNSDDLNRSRESAQGLNT
jgi:hypothetical protein